MRKCYFLLPLLPAVLALGCREKAETGGEGFSMDRRSARPAVEAPAPVTGTPASMRVDLTSTGVGPVTSLELPPTLDAALANKGERYYNRLCVACHRIGKKSIGPALNGILERRNPAWIMNMTLKPEQMVKKDPLARDLLLEYDGSPMANQGLSQDQARAILEYLRTLK